MTAAKKENAELAGEKAMKVKSRRAVEPVSAAARGIGPPDG